jgi:2-(1,2-epoxy-1,2-dihydrophenyl)acetyl-CoA isomerase
MPSSDTILKRVDSAVATLTLNRPESLNTLNPDMAKALRSATAGLAADSGVRCVVIGGAGGHFMAGGDIGYFHQCLSLAPEERAAAFSEVIGAVHATILNLRRMPQPVVARVEGACAGFGVSLMAACDLAVCADDAVFSLAYSRIGTTPDGGSTWALPRIVGLKRAMAMVLLADRFGADEALQMGLVNQVVAKEELPAATAELAGRLAAGPSRAYAGAQALLNESLQSTLEEQLRAEERQFIEGVKQADFEEGVRAFIDKRPPKFGG